MVSRVTTRVRLHLSCAGPSQACRGNHVGNAGKTTSCIFVYPDSGSEKNQCARVHGTRPKQTNLCVFSGVFFLTSTSCKINKHSPFPSLFSLVPTTYPLCCHLGRKNDAVTCPKAHREIVTLMRKSETLLTCQDDVN